MFENNIGPTERFEWRQATADEIPRRVLAARQIATAWAEHPRRWKKSVRSAFMAVLNRHIQIEDRKTNWSVLEAFADAKGFGVDTAGPAQFFEPVAFSYLDAKTGKRLWGFVAFVGADLWVNI